MPRSIESSDFFPLEREIKTPEQKIEANSVFDPSAVEKELNEILINSDSYNLAEKKVLADILLKEDPDRGLDILDAFNLPKEEVEKIINSWSFAVHQSALLERIGKQIIKEKKEIDDQNLAKELLDKNKKLKQREISSEYKTENSLTETISPEVKNFAEKINQYYDLIRGEKKIAPKKEFLSPQIFSTGEEMAKELAEVNEERGVYTGKLRDLIIKKGFEQGDENLMPIIKKELNISAEKIDYEQWSIFFKKIKTSEEREAIIKKISDNYLQSKPEEVELSELLSQPTIKDEKILANFQKKLDIDDVSWQEFIKKNWTRSSFSSLLKINTEKELKKELLKSLAIRYPDKNLELVKDSATGQYLITEKGKEQKDVIEQKIDQSLNKEIRTEYLIDRIKLEQSRLCGEKVISEVAIDDDFSRMVVDGVPEWHKFSNFSDLSFSKDGQHYAYKALIRGDIDQGEGEFAVIDGKMGKIFEKISNLKLLPDGRCFYIGKKFYGKSYVVIDHIVGKEGFENEIKDIVFSNDGKHYAYIGFPDNRAENCAVYIDGKKSVATEVNAGECKDFQFSPDGKHYSYNILSIDQDNLQATTYQVVDDCISGPYEEVFNFKFVDRPENDIDPDEVDYYYYARISDNEYCKVTADGGRGTPFYSPSDRFSFSSDGKRYGCRTHSNQEEKGYKEYMLINGVPEKEFEEVGKLTFSQDSKSYAYPAKVDDNKWKMIVNSKEEKDFFENIADFRFSADGNHYSYIGQNGGSFCVVEDGIKGEYLLGTSRESVYLPDLTKVAYKCSYKRFPVKDGNTVKEEGQFVLNDGVYGKEYPWVDDLTFSPDGKHLAYKAGTKDFIQKELFVFDEVEDKESFDKIGFDSIKISTDGKYRAYVGCNRLTDDPNSIPSDDDEWYYQVVLNGEKQEDEFDDICDLQFLPGKLVYTGVIGDRLVKVVKKLEEDNEQEKKSQEDQIVLTPREELKKDLLEQIDAKDWLGALGSLGIKPETLEEKVSNGKESLAQSKSIVDRLGRLIKKSPDIFTPTVSAQSSVLPSRFAEKIVNNYLFPEVAQKKKEQLLKNSYLQRYSGYSGFNGSNDVVNKNSALEYLGGVFANNERERIKGGDPKLSKGEQAEIFFLDSPVTGFFIRNIFDKYNFQTREWERKKRIKKEAQSTEIVSADLLDDKILTITLSEKANKNKDIKLPYLVGSKILEDKIIFTENKSNQKKKIKCQKNDYGEAIIQNTLTDGKFSYQLKYDAEKKFSLPKFDLTQKELDKFYSEIDQDLKNEIIKIWPSEIKLFLSQIKDLSPVERLKAIESYLHEIFYYDFDNAEIEPLKQKANSLEEKIMIMKERMNEIKQKSNDKELVKLLGKKFAGICADFCEFGTALLRSTNLASGIMLGYNVSGDTTVRSGDAHGISFVELPDVDNQLKSIPVDFTPAGTNVREQRLLNSIRLPNLNKREELAQKELTKEAENKITKFANLSDKELSRLSESEIKKTLAIYLKDIERNFDARETEAIIDAYLYSGIKNENEAVIKNELIEKLNREKENIKREESKDLTKKNIKVDLLGLISDFNRRLVKSLPQEQSAESWKIAEKIFELVKDELDEKEYQGIKLAIKYLSTQNKNK